MSPTAESRPDRVSPLYEQWRVKTLAEGWAFADDWPGAVVETMARVVAAEGRHGERCAGVARELGEYRAECGIGLADGLRDLAALYEIADASEPPFDVTRSFAIGWSELAVSSIVAGSATDPLTGFGTPGYLVRRLHELAQRSSSCEPSPEYHALVVRPAATEGWQSVVRRSVVARVMDGILSSGEPKGVLPSGAFVGVVESAVADEHAALMRRRLAEIEEAGYVTIELRAVPATLDDLERSN